VRQPDVGAVSDVRLRNLATIKTSMTNECNYCATHTSIYTRRQRENIFKHVLENAGEKSIASIKTADIVAGIERRSKTPAQARNFLKTMRGLFKWAARANHIKGDPTVAAAMP
jgi:site-specific recombinase XerD